MMAPAPVLSVTPHSLRSARLALIYVPNANAIEPVASGCCGRFHLGLGGRDAGALSLVGTSADNAVIGYEIKLEFRRQGLATEAVAALMKAARGFGLTLLSAHCRSDNLASLGVLEKNGFELASSTPWQIDGDSTRHYLVYQWTAARTMQR